MCSHVSLEMVIGVERLLADRTLLGLLALVQLEVVLQQVGLEELELALGALDVDLQLGVLGHLGHHGVLTHRLILTSSSLGTSRPLLFGLRDNFTPQHQFPETFSFSTSQRFPSNRTLRNNFILILFKKRMSSLKITFSDIFPFSSSQPSPQNHLVEKFTRCWRF